MREGYPATKRAVDVAAAALGLVLAAAPMAIVAACVRATMGGPVIFSQERVTIGGRRFRLLKFRSMLPETAELHADDDRLTRLGAFLRATSLDELPSLVNILRGEMSLVGPRPLPPAYLPRFSTEQARRHEVRAGLTGLAQVSGRNALTWDDRLALDVTYVQRMGPRLDAQILVRTLTTVLRRDGISEDGHVTMSDFPGPLRTADVTFTRGGEHGQWIARSGSGSDLADVQIGPADAPETAHITLRPAAAQVAGLAHVFVLAVNHARAAGFQWADMYLEGEGDLLALHEAAGLRVVETAPPAADHGQLRAFIGFDQ